MISRRLFRPTLVLSFLCIALSAFGVPTQFEFSYTFSTGELITGSFSGDESAGRIRNIQDAKLNIGGADYFQVDVFGYDPLTDSLVASEAVASTDLFFTNLIFMDPSWMWEFYLVYGVDHPFTADASVADIMTGVVAQAWAPDIGTWSVRPASVPEAGTTFFLLSAALGGVALLKRRFSGLSA